MIAQNPDAGMFISFYTSLRGVIEPARVVRDSTATVLSLRPSRASTKVAHITPPKFDSDEDMDDDFETGNAEAADPVYNPVFSPYTPGIPTKKTEIVTHITCFLLLSISHNNHQKFLSSRGRIDPNDPCFEFSPERDAHTFTLQEPAIKSRIEDDGGPDVYELDDNGNFVHNPDIPRAFSIECKNIVCDAVGQHLAELHKLIQQRTNFYGIETETDLDDRPPSFFQVMLLSAQGKYIGLVVGTVSKL